MLLAFGTVFLGGLKNLQNIEDILRKIWYNKENYDSKEGLTMKKSIFGRIVALLLCAVVLLSCVACAGEEEGETIPSGMQLATAAGADFRLYVPTHWSANTAYGVSGGYYHLVQQSTVSMMKYPVAEISDTAELPAPTEENAMLKERADWFYNAVLLPQINEMKSGEISEADQHGVEVLMDGVNAMQYHVKTTVDGESLHFLYVVAEKNDAFYVLTYIVTSELYVMLVEDYVNILNAVRFAEPYEPKENAKEIDADADAPDGMKLASNGDVSYVLYVPADWTIDRTQQIFAASAPSGRANVSVVPYMPSSAEPMSVMEYFEESRRLMEMTSSGSFGWVDENNQGVEIKLGGSPAMCYEYYYRIGGVGYRYMQIIAAYKGMFYSFTYTAADDGYDAHLAEVEKILSVFEFR